MNGGDGGILAVRIESGLVAGTPTTEVTRALRRAVMARVQRAIGPHRLLPAFFSGHEPDGSPLKRATSPHLAFVFDPVREFLLVIAPHLLERREATQQERQHLHVLDEALAGFHDLRAGRAGRLCLEPVLLDPERDPLLTPSHVWESVTPYQVTRHAKSSSAAAALTENLLAEGRRVGLPTPRVSVLRAKGVREVGLVGEVRLKFRKAVPGPVLLGKTRYLGGGLFASRNDGPEA